MGVDLPKPKSLLITIKAHKSGFFPFLSTCNGGINGSKQVKHKSIKYNRCKTKQLTHIHTCIRFKAAMSLMIV